MYNILGCVVSDYRDAVGRLNEHGYYVSPSKKLIRICDPYSTGGQSILTTLKPSKPFGEDGMIELTEFINGVIKELDYWQAHS